ncbi:PREDICTED: uncharacterized protein LOC104809156 [Tarenaya hassleriana]|uniref:uncharacterized protein LOC104809156 n=1 Tax=Tarenaya hassleriana TaxID=28532 RepID=UPI00053C9FD0|nr:PREDICTED: uncharacterized protein LOC104809156 [Tarenaya hassleriana]
MEVGIELSLECSCLGPGDRSFLASFLSSFLASFLSIFRALQATDVLISDTGKRVGIRVDLNEEPPILGSSSVGIGSGYKLRDDVEDCVNDQGTFEVDDWDVDTPVVDVDVDDWDVETRMETPQPRAKRVLFCDQDAEVDFDLEMTTPRPDKKHILVCEGSSNVHKKVDLLNNTSHIYEGQFFEDKLSFRLAIEKIALNNTYGYRIVKSSGNTIVAQCPVNRCGWMVRAVKKDGAGVFCVRKYKSEHTCSIDDRNKYVRRPPANLASHFLYEKVKGSAREFKPKDVKKNMLTDYGFDMTYWQAWKAKEKAIDIVRASPENSFNFLPAYLELIQEANSGTVTSYVVDEDCRFKYAFIAFGACLRGFCYMRKVIVVDGTFLTGKFKGVLLVAVCQDGNNHIYPIAFGVVDSENVDSWEWFLMQLRSSIEDNENLVFISDRHASILRTIAKIFPLAKHGICVYHLLKNIRTRFKSRKIVDLVREAAMAYTTSHFDRVFAQIHLADERVAKYLEDVDVKMWSRAYFKGLRYNILTSNIAESMNSVTRDVRDYPIVPLLDHIRSILTKWFCERRTQANICTQDFTPETVVTVEDLLEKSRKLQVHNICPGQYQVKGGQHEHVVNLDCSTCTCRAFDILKTPCVHAIAAATRSQLSIQILIDPFYSTKFWRLAYEDSIYPIGVPMEDWQVSEDVADEICGNPIVRRPIGRPKKKRIPSAAEKYSKKTQRSHRCTRCGKTGHNRATCKEAI